VIFTLLKIFVIHDFSQQKKNKNISKQILSHMSRIQRIYTFKIESTRRELKLQLTFIFSKK